MIAQSLFANVNSGSDSTGDGSPESPYQTIAKAMSVAGGLSPTSSSPVTIFLSSGIYDESVSLLPFVNLCGLVPDLSIVVGTSDSETFQIDTSAWADQTNPLSSITNLFIFSALTFDFSGVASTCSVTLTNIDTEADVEFIGSSYGSGCSIVGCELGDGEDSTVVFTAGGGSDGGSQAFFFISDSEFINDASFVSTSEVGIFAWVYQSSFYLPTEDSTLTLDASAGSSVSVSANSTNIAGELALIGTGAAYNAAGLLPATISTSGGASLSQISLEGQLPAAQTTYAAATPGDWASSAPTTVQSAIDRMANLLKTLNGGTPIP